MTDWSAISTENCTVQRTLDLIGEKWTLALIRDAACGLHRYEEFQRHIGLSHAVLSDRLRTLVDAGILETCEYREPGRRARNEYRLTRKGWDLHPVLIALMKWGDRHVAGPEGPPLEVRHTDCGHDVAVEVRCTDPTCRGARRALTPLDTTPVPGPGARPDPRATEAVR